MSAMASTMTNDWPTKGETHSLDSEFGRIKTL